MVLFDKDVRIAEKSAIAQALLQHPTPVHFDPGKPGGRKFDQVTSTICYNLLV